MKALAVALIFAALVWVIWIGRSHRINYLPFRQLEPGQVNPPLEKVGTMWPIPEGTKLWMRSNQQPYAIVISSDEKMVYTKSCRRNFFKREQAIYKHVVDGETIKIAFKEVIGK